MDDLISQILVASVPLRESVSPPDFPDLVKSVQSKIVELFRYSNLNLVPPFLSSIMKSIDEYVKLSDKRKKFAAAISLTALIQLFPFDDFVPQYQPIIERLLKPGYKPLLKIGTLVLGQFTKIRGQNRDLFLRELVEQSGKQLKQTMNIDSRYASAIIWEELSKTAPEHLFALDTQFITTITESLTLGDLEISDILIHTCENIFDSKSAPLGAELMTQMPEYLLKIIKDGFANAQTIDQILANLRLLLFLLEIKPYLPKTVIETQIQPHCLQLLKHINTNIVEYSILALTKMKTINEIDVDPKIIEGIINMLFVWARKDAMKTIGTLSEVFKAFPDSIEGQISKIIKRLDDFMKSVNPAVGPPFTFKISIAIIESLPPDINIEPILDNIITILNKSIVPMPIHFVIKALNKSHPQWGQEFSLFKYTMLQIIRQELTITQTRTDRIMYSLLALNKIKNITFTDALEFNSLISKLKKNKDIEVRENISKTCIKLFDDFPEEIPLATIRKLVKFALEDPSPRVRMRTLKSFKKSTYRYLSQPDIFSVLSNFIYDEDIEIRKECFYLIRNLPIFQKSVIRNILLSSIKQTILKFNVVTAEIEPAWHVFPNLISSCGSFLPVYAEAIFGKFISLLRQRFKSTEIKERSLNYMNSAILLTIDESLIKSVTKLHIMCPKIIPAAPIIDILGTILTLPVHPWTIEQSLKSLKNLVASGTIVFEYKDLLSSLFDLIKTNQSIKIVTKAMKVIGAIGMVELPNIKPKKHPLIVKNGMSNRQKFNKYFISKYFKYLVDLFITFNLESTREAIAKCISCLFLYAPNEIQSFQSFIGIFIDFVHKNSSSSKLSLFYHYLTVMIESSGHLIANYVDKIFQAIEDNWHDKFTREGCIVLSSLIIATDGRCDSILQLVVSVSFLLAKTKKNAEDVSNDIFNLLRVIAQYNNNFLLPIVTGVLEILSDVNYPSYLHEQCFDTIEFVIKYCNSAVYIPPIKRCLVNVTQRSQLRWHDRSKQLIDLINQTDFSIPTEKFNFSNQPTQPKFGPFSADYFIEKFALPRTKENTVNFSLISNWFVDLRNYFIMESPNVLIRSMQFLPSYPNFAFMFSYLSIYLQSSDDEKERLSNNLKSILSYKNLPNVVLEQFLELIEFSLLCEIDFKLDLSVLVKNCEERHFYSQALFLLESDLAFKSDKNMTSSQIQNLVLLNEFSNRHTEAKGIARVNKEIIKHKVWMALGGWESAINIIEQKVKNPPKVSQLIIKPNVPDKFITEIDDEYSDSSSDSGQIQLSKNKNATMINLLENSQKVTPKFVTEKDDGENDMTFFDKVISYTETDNWGEIHKMKKEFEQKNTLEQSLLAKYFWTSELYTGTKEEALRISNKTGSYTVSDCIAKIILYIKCDKLDDAQDLIHISWRYLANTVSTTEKNNETLIKEYLFQSLQLHELCDVIDILTNDEKSEDFKTIWPEHIRYLKDYPRYQVQLYKIRSLAPGVIDLEDLAFHIFMCNMKAGHNNESNRLKDIFFPDLNSSHSKYANLLMHNVEDPQVYKDLLQDAPENLKPRIYNTIGKVLYKKSLTTENLKESLDFLLKGKNSYQSQSEVLMLLAFLEKNVEYAIKAVEVLGIAMNIKKNKILLIINQILSLLVQFSDSKTLSEKISEVLSTKPKNIYLNLNSTLFGLVLHPSKFVSKIAKQILNYMILETPQVVAFDLFTSLQTNKDAEIFEDLSELFQHEHPIFYAQLDLVCQKMTKISYTIYNFWIDKLNELHSHLKQKEYDQTKSLVKKLLTSLSGFSSCRYEEIFKSNFKYKAALQEIHDNPADEENIQIVQEIFHDITSRQDSIRALPLSSLDDILDKKQSWSINLLGKHNKPDVKIQKFFHSVERWKNGFKISIIGTDGKKYSYHLQRRSIIYKNEPSEQFMALIDSFTSFINVEHRSLIQISPGVTLHEILKGHISILDLLILYKQNCGQNPELEILNITQKLDSLQEKEKKIRKIKHLTEGDNKFTLAKAIFVTSRNANSWLNRVSTFSASTGALSVLSYLFGSVNSGPSDILFEKSTGATTFTAFRVTGESQKVPFRLTPMFESALGTCGVNGPFRVSMMKYLKSIRHNANSLSPILQFVLGKTPFADPCLSKSYVGKYGAETHLNQDIELLNERIVGTGKDLDTEVDDLIKAATDMNNIAEMPSQWIPWW
ncbi:PIKK family atypical protein kinase [Trichomonas vaginalis G3]|uniref:PIKK family atypical protein kinase n=1 Tax=Trichomonas vaginalis (strain ATCC PRA-98 / G3) TaxID=412133 RepID=A2EC30_TRIV3|nr:protein serine/threonine kinase protein [Trichomonas vaginalis G3]EAY09805.1 PIKK family atypical protein kinase [Trichomonas vaginalis G3]KAI5525756.1 protein serine/threonine kinase protein [Trichomonas vaginalis G3]|eukprot:XP_001322028.1 PIKK family atypical protein kinase [Trichomonas vaginalis G3]